MAERYPGDGAAANGFGRCTLQAWEARLLYEAGYVAPPDTSTPSGWKLSVGGIPIPPVLTLEELPYEIREFISDMDDPSAAERPVNLLYWEDLFAARLLYEAGYVAPPDTSTPSGWKLSVGGIPIPPVLTLEELPYEIREFISDMDDPSAAERPDNLLYWEDLFADRRAQELAHHEGPPNESPMKRNNSDDHRRFWSTPGRTLRSVMEHINTGNKPRFGYPRTPVSALRSGRRPPANWMPRRMASMSSSSFASASHSSGSTPLPTPTGPSSGPRPVKREVVSPVRLPPRTRSRGLIIGEPRATASPTGHLRLRRPKIEGSAPPGNSALRMALEQSLRDSVPQPPALEPSSPDILKWSRKDWEEAERQRVHRLQQQAEEQAARRRVMSGCELAYQGAPLYVLDDDKDKGPSYHPWRSDDPARFQPLWSRFAFPCPPSSSSPLLANGLSSGSPVRLRWFCRSVGPPFGGSSVFVRVCVGWGGSVRSFVFLWDSRYCWFGCLRNLARLVSCFLLRRL